LSEKIGYGERVYEYFPFFNWPVKEGQSRSKRKEVRGGTLKRRAGAQVISFSCIMVREQEHLLAGKKRSNKKDFKEIGLGKGEDLRLYAYLP